MGAISQAMGFVDFKAVSAAAANSLEHLVPRVLPGGYRDGAEWVVRNPTRHDTEQRSFKINLRTGAWSDFATQEGGGDMIDLLAYLSGKSKLDAARELVPPHSDYDSLV
jgi:putative DNA primase/helicase